MKGAEHCKRTQVMTSTGNVLMHVVECVEWWCSAPPGPLSQRSLPRQLVAASQDPCAPLVLSGVVVWYDAPVLPP
jgi:hypothetical protein